MAVLTSGQLNFLRRKCSPLPNVDYDKTAINAAFQAVEDWFEGQRAQINTDINAAAPGLSVDTKTQIVGNYLIQKSVRELA